jgi:regulator of sigma D
MDTTITTGDYKLQEEKQTRIKTIINASTASLINSFFNTSTTQTEQQAVIEVAQDLGLLELSDVLIERFNIGR